MYFHENGYIFQNTKNQSENGIILHFYKCIVQHHGGQLDSHFCIQLVAIPQIMQALNISIAHLQKNELF